MPEKTTELAAMKERAHNYIDAAYQGLANMGDFIIREAQVRLSKELADALIDNVPLAAEAPTGTGKTLAYLIGSLAASAQLSTDKPRPIVVATATKALQDQILQGDFPKLVKAGLAHDAEAVVMKGKGSYLCVRDAALLQQQLAQMGFDYESYTDDSVPYIELRPLTTLLDLYHKGDWSGELDQVRGVEQNQLRGIAVNGDTCTRKRCPNYRECAYYKAKEQVKTARIVVTNQDLLLRDLALSAEAQVATLDIDDYIAVIDEAHHLPDKALAVGSSDIRMWELLNALQKLPGLVNSVSESSTLMALLSAGTPDYDPAVKFDSAQGLEAAKRLNDALLNEEVNEHGSKRFPKGAVPGHLVLLAEQLRDSMLGLHGALDEFMTVAKEAPVLSTSTTREGKLVVEAIRRASSASRSITGARLGLIRFTTKTLRGVRWMERKERAVSLHFSPLEGAQVLRPLLWNTDRARPALLSATLRGMDEFGRFSRASGLPDNARKAVLPHVFEYRNNLLTVAGMTFSPKPHERLHYLEELKRELAKRIDPSEGTLLILPSWSALKDVTPSLKRAFGEKRVKVQGEMPIKALIDQHKQDIDRKEGSILVGVATVAEGLDLPGAYCTHVCIAALPFPVPDTPVEKEVSEMLGNNYFGQRSLPQATLVLIQEVGRLLRRESDRGRVTVFDHRLGSTNYGKQMLKALPPFKVVIEPAVR
jgi:ATP-dependent DNA helicase DinG